MGPTSSALLLILHSLDNRRCNIQETTVAENVRKRRLSSRSTTGIAGVNFFTDKFGYDRYIATWYENGKPRNRCFSVLKYGKEEALRLACECRTEMAARSGIETRIPAKRARGPEDTSIPMAKRRRKVHETQ